MLDVTWLKASFKVSASMGRCGFLKKDCLAGATMGLRSAGWLLALVLDGLVSVRCGHIMNFLFNGLHNTLSVEVYISS